MRKIQFISLFILLLFVAMMIPVSAERAPRLTDAAGLLSESEQAELISTLDQISEKHQVDVIVVTVDSLGEMTPAECAEYFYDNFDYCKKKGENPRQVDGIILTADKEIEWNSVCVIFSPNAFTHPQDFVKGKADGNKLGLGNRLLEMPRVLSSDKFQDWLAKSRINDKKMSYTPIDIQIRRK